MPFTVSHSAAVLPFLGRGLPASALVIGALVPDLPYYLSVPVSATATHSWHALIGIDLVFGIVLFLLWHLLLVPPLIWLAPGGMQARIPEQIRTAGRIGSAWDLGVVCLGLAVGGFTHLALDLFTHPGVRPGWPVIEWNIAFAGLPLSRWLHLWLSVLGLLLLALYLTRWWYRAPLVGQVDPITPALRWTFVVVVLSLSLVGGLEGVPWHRLMTHGISQGALIAGILGFFSTLITWVLVGAVAWHVAHGSRRVRFPSR